MSVEQLCQIFKTFGCVILTIVCLMRRLLENLGNQQTIQSFFPELGKIGHLYTPNGLN